MKPSNYLYRSSDRSGYRRLIGLFFVKTTRNFPVVRGFRVLGVMLIAGLLTLQGSTVASATTPTTTTAVIGTPQWKQWEHAIDQLPIPHSGCFSASYPNLQWQGAACTNAHSSAAPELPATHDAAQPLDTMGPPELVGTTTDYVAQSTGEPITSVTGSFPNISTGATEHSATTPTQPPNATQPNLYSLQINSTTKLKSPQCSTNPHPNPSCRGWQQFVYNSGTKKIFIQYWLLTYANTNTLTHTTQCPPTFTNHSITTTPTKKVPKRNQRPKDCYKPTTNNHGKGLTENPSVQTLTKVTFVATATPTGTDTLRMTTLKTGMVVVTGTKDSLLGLGHVWSQAEFNIFGNDDAHVADFSATTTLKVKTTVETGGFAGATEIKCVITSFTGELNNLTLLPSPTFTTKSLGAGMLFQEGTRGHSFTHNPPSCAGAHGFGETHLTTLSKLHYTFQAQGDFELATTGPTTTAPPTTTKPHITTVPTTTTLTDSTTTAPASPRAPSTRTQQNFNVQARQVPVKESYGTVAYNSAVAARVDTSDVAVCTSPTRLEVNDSTVTLPNGSRMTLPGGASVSLENGAYVIRDGTGNSVRAQVRSNTIPIPAGGPKVITNINVTVGIGTWPEPVKGLLASAASNPDAIEARTGTILTSPYTFIEFYDVYANSWRVTPSQSLLSPCGAPPPSTVPHNVLTASNLTPTIAKTARAVCVAAGVKGALLNDCTLDVAVLGKTAVNGYLGATAISTTVTVATINPAPVPTTSLSGGGQSGPFISVPTGTPVTDTATLHGVSATAGGTVTYRVFSNDTCTTAVATATSTVKVSTGVVPMSSPVTLPRGGTYFWKATYSGDAVNAPSYSTCGLAGEVETVTPRPTRLTTSLSGSGVFGGGPCWWLGDFITVFAGTAVTDSATLTGANASFAVGTVTYTVYAPTFSPTSPYIQWKPVASGGTVTVTNGKVPNSEPVTLPPGTYEWQATYSGDPSNRPSTSPLGSETETVVPVPQCKYGWQWGLNGGCKVSH